MGQNETRLWSTVAIWLAVAVIAITAMVTRVQIDGGALVALFFVLIIGGAGGTHAIWNSGSSAAQSAEKTKRRSKVERLVEGLDDYELEELRTRLMDHNDSQATSLDELLKENGRQRL